MREREEKRDLTLKLLEVASSQILESMLSELTKRIILIKISKIRLDLPHLEEQNKFVASKPEVQ